MFRVFWQQILRSTFVANGSFITQTFLRIPKGSPIYRQAVTLTAFCLTAGMHAAGLWAMAPTCDVKPLLLWYILMGLAIALEDLAKGLFFRVRGKGAASRQWKLFGYIWIWVYLAWSLPKALFPMISCDLACEQ